MLKSGCVRNLGIMILIKRSIVKRLGLDSKKITILHLLMRTPLNNGDLSEMGIPLCWIAMLDPSKYESTCEYALMRDNGEERV